MSSLSLKAFIPGLARILGSTPAALYERQRALVRSGILGVEEGRGPGSGVHAGPYSVALLLIAVLATDSLSETEDRVACIAKAAPRGKQRCPFSQRGSFVDAIAHSLAMLSASREIESITVDRSEMSGAIHYRDGGRKAVSVFGGKVDCPANLTVQARLGGEAVIAIANDLHAILGEIET